MQQRIIPFLTMEAALQYASFLSLLAGAAVLFVLPNAVVIQYNGQAIMVMVRQDQGD